MFSAGFELCLLLSVESTVASTRGFVFAVVWVARPLQKQSQSNVGPAPSAAQGIYRHIPYCIYRGTHDELGVSFLVNCVLGFLGPSRLEA